MWLHWASHLGTKTEYLKSKHTHSFISPWSGDFTHFSHCLACVMSKVLVSPGRSDCLVLVPVPLWLCVLCPCLISTITGRCPGEHGGAASARLQRARAVPRGQRGVHAARSTWGLHAPAGADQPLCPLTDAHEAHVQQEALDAHLPCG